ncbi:Brp/Blh family beta-carotene 15,15'-dioxygenase [Spiribacter salinus]|uniref:Brp/Blh family beta-carotene 15,15'-dioxygenase n=1 Tax=Spiribacter salinus TaxID=1335746 RepID=UPI001C978649|nr:Brp/Blh family beta-carotene 15,15'-dioxygenase [Spiribacter salinus]MBY5268326.1 hypothetical protein [Spiribacter salinus]
MSATERLPAFWLFPVGLVLALGFSSLPGQWPLYAVLAIGVMVFGLPHGSLDTAVAKQHLGVTQPARLALFFAAYLGLGALVLAIWWQIPTVALAAFLLYSAVHFGDDVSARLGRLGATGYGLWLLSLPLVLRPADVLPLFEALGAGNAPVILATAPWALGIGGILLAVGLYQSPNRAMSDWRDPALLTLGAAMLHPLAYFVAYFCFLHSPRHLELAARDLGLYSWRDRLAAVAPTTLATYALVAAAVPFLIGLPMDAMLLRLVFITLAALTVPHMILELIASPRRQA